MAGDEFVGCLVCEEQCLWVTGQWFLVMSEEVSLPLMSFQVVSAGSEGRVCTSSPSSPDRWNMLIYCRRRRKTEDRKGWKKVWTSKKGKNMTLERKKTEAEGVAAWVVWESPINYTYKILVHLHSSPIENTTERYFSMDKMLPGGSVSQTFCCIRSGGAMWVWWIWWHRIWPSPWKSDTLCKHPPPPVRCRSVTNGGNAPQES